MASLNPTFMSAFIKLIEATRLIPQATNLTTQSKHKVDPVTGNKLYDDGRQPYL